MDFSKKPNIMACMVSGFKWTTLPMLTSMTVLTGCSGGSNNLADPTVTNPVVTCASVSSTTCVTAQFVSSSPVAGLNYECGLVKDVTDATGTVKCPDNSTATFFVQSADTTKRIILGTYTILSKRDASRTATNSLVSITPLNLVPAAVGASSLSDSVAAPVVYIAQLLETLRSSTAPYNATSPSSRIVIDATTQTALNLLTSSITQAELQSGNYLSKVQPVLTALNTSMVTTTDTQTRLQQTLQTVQAGSYYSSIAWLLRLAGAINENVATSAVATSNANDYALLGLNNLIDRSGYAVGQGAEWHGDITPKTTTGATTAINLLTDTDYTRLAFNRNAVNTPSFLNPVSNFMGTNYKWQAQNYTLDSDNVWQPQTTTQLGDAVFSNGRLLGGTFVVGNKTLWQNVMNDTITTPPTNELATWTQQYGGSDYYTGTLTLQKVRSVDPFLDPSVFQTTTTVGKGNKAIFPLHAVLTFKYNDSTCSSTTTYCKQLGDLGITILENGNIITDMAQQCLAVDPTTMKNTAGTQQYRIGLVGAANQGVTNKSSLYVSPIIMLSGAQFDQKDVSGKIVSSLDGIQIGTLTNALSVKVDVSGVLNGYLSVSDNTSTSTTTGDASTAQATYTNFYDNLKSFKASPTAQETAVAKRSVGALSIALTPCYTPSIGL